MTVDCPALCCAVQGGGQVDMTVGCLQPGLCIPPVKLTERGDIVLILIRAFTAGRVGVAVGERMAAAAERGEQGWCATKNAWALWAWGVTCLARYNEKERTMIE
jgi:hypothetical protein